MHKKKTENLKHINIIYMYSCS